MLKQVADASNLSVTVQVATGRIDMNTLRLIAVTLALASLAGAAGAAPALDAAGK